VNRWRAGSLRSGLTWRMVGMQALVVLAFVGVASVAILRLTSADQGLDEDILYDISASISRSQSGELLLSPSDDLRELIADYPGLWFHAEDASGAVLREGEFPARLEEMLLYFKKLNSADIATSETDRLPLAVMRRQSSAAGDLWVVAGGGPVVSFRSVLADLVNPGFLILLLALTAVSFLFIPFMITGQLRGVDDIAGEADTIDVNKTGIRLSSTRVPLELHSLVGAVNAALARLDLGIERQRRFLADAAHELRTPIAVLQTRLGTLPRDQKRAGLMLDIARLSNLADQLLDLQRLEVDQAPMQPVDLVRLAAEVTADLAPLAIAGKTEIEFSAEAERILVQADSGSLSRAIVNLVQNAIVHGGPGCTIRVEVDRLGHLRVIDNGPGVPEFHRDLIFEPFHRVIPRDQGTGLGLHLVKSIVTHHGGELQVAETPGGGATFEIRLQLVAPLAN